MPLRELDKLGRPRATGDIEGRGCELRRVARQFTQNANRSRLGIGFVDGKLNRGALNRGPGGNVDVDKPDADVLFVGPSAFRAQLQVRTRQVDVVAFGNVLLGVVGPGRNLDRDGDRLAGGDPDDVDGNATDVPAVEYANDRG